MRNKMTEFESSMMGASVKIKCEMCDKVIGKKHMKGHINTVHKKLKPHQCDKCPAKFASRGALNAHIVIHTEDRNFVCQDCGNTFKTKAFLKRHSLIHLEVKPYICDDCGKSFSDPSYFTNHKKEQHSGPNPFQCNICKMGFRMRKSLKLHLKKHSSDYLPKPKIFSSGPKKVYTDEDRKKILEKVEEIGTNKTARELGVCRSVIQSWLNQKREKYRCEQCEKCFKNANVLKRHIFSNHEKKSENHTAWSFDNQFRENAVAYVKKFSLKEAMTKFDVAERTILRWVQLFKNSFTCLFCQKIFNNEEKIRKHLSKKHKIIKKEEQDGNFTHVKAESETLVTSKISEYVHNDIYMDDEAMEESKNQQPFIEVSEDEDDCGIISSTENEYVVSNVGTKNQEGSIFFSLILCFFGCIFYCMTYKNFQDKKSEREIMLSEVWEESDPKRDKIVKGLKKEYSEKQNESIGEFEVKVEHDNETMNNFPSIPVSLDESTYDDCNISEPGVTIKTEKVNEVVKNEMDTEHIQPSIISPPVKSILKLQTTKQAKNIEGKLNKCSFCEKKFNNKLRLKYHVNTHTKEKPFVCNICQNSFYSPRALRRHGLLHKEKAIACSHCPKLFSTQKLLDAHKRGLGQIFKCSLCSNVYARKQFLRDHERRKHTGETPYSCSFCENKFSMSYMLKNHIDRKHRNVPQTFVCEICGKEFNRKSYLLKHEKTHTKERPSFVCNICQNSFYSPRDLRRHGLLHKEKTIACSHCPKFFSDQTLLDTHLRGLGQSFKCSLCSNVYTKKRFLQDHERRKHTGETPYSCSLCEKKFTMSYMLKDHINRDHTDVPQKFVCQFCGKKYNRKSTMLEHSKTHSGGDPSTTCDICEDTFNTKLAYKHHQNKHQEKFKCEECGKCFGNPRNFEHHKISHSGLKQFQCSCCVKAYSSMKSLKKHMEIKHDEIQGKSLTYRCNNCDKAYTNKRSLEKHSKKH